MTKIGIDNMRRFEDLLDEEGLYHVWDILDKIDAGDMQSFFVGDTWVITEVHTYPRAKVLTIAYVVGNFKDLAAAELEVLQFAKEHGCTRLSAFGVRKGWLRIAEGTKWRSQSNVYRREI